MMKAHAPRVISAARAVAHSLEIRALRMTRRLRLRSLIARPTAYAMKNPTRARIDIILLEGLKTVKNSSEA